MKGKKKIIVVVLLSIIVILGILVAAFLFQLNTNAINENDYNAYIASEERLMEIEKIYLNDEGFVPKEDVSALINEVEIEVKNQVNNGSIQEYNRDDNNIYIKYKSGIEYVFVPHEENALALGEDNNIITLEPNQDDYSVGVSRFKAWIDKKFNNLAYQGSYSVPANAKLISDKYPDKFTYNENPMPDYNTIMDDEFSSFTNSRVTVERLKSIGDYKVVIFEGHGNNNESIHSILFTGESFIGWKEFSKYKDDIARGEVILSSFPAIGNVPYSVVRTYGVTSKFFERHLSEMDNTLIFLGSCRSGKDRVLADTFLSKGASAVLGFDESVSMEFEMIARSMFFYNLTNEDISVVEAYNRTVNRIGRDNELENAGLVYFDKDYSASNYTLSGNKPSSNKSEEVKNESTSPFKAAEYILPTPNGYLCSTGKDIYFKEAINDNGVKIASNGNYKQLLSDGTTLYYCDGFTNTIENRYDSEKVISINTDGTLQKELFSSEGYVSFITKYNNCIYYIDSLSSEKTKFICYDVTKNTKSELLSEKMKDNYLPYAFCLEDNIYLFLYSNSSDKITIISYDLNSGKNEELLTLNGSGYYRYADDDKIIFDLKTDEGVYYYILEKGDNITKSALISNDFSYQEVSSDGKYALFFSNINSDNFDLYKIDLKTGEQTVTENGAAKYKNKNYFIVHDLVNPQNIIFGYNIGLYNSDNNSVVLKKHDDFEINIMKQMWVVDNYLVDSDLNCYRIYDDNIEETSFDSSEILSKLNEPFTFSSGAGAWGTTLQINNDGSFSGSYHDSDMGDRNDSYPKGTVYYCNFSGKFGDIKKINEYTYSMKMKKIEYNNEPNTEEIKDGFLYKYSSAYGLDEADTVLIYTPETPISDLPEEFTSWTSRLIPPSGETLGYYGLYNVNEEEGFVSQNK